MAPHVTITGRSPAVLPAYVMPHQARGGLTLYVLAAAVTYHTAYGAQTIPRGYVTDFASIPWVAARHISPTASHAWAALLHDWRYSIGEDGKRHIADRMFRDQMILDDVNPTQRDLMFAAVRLFGTGGYRRAKGWWNTDNFAAPWNGRPRRPPFRREDAFDGRPFGLIPINESTVKCSQSST